jgi:predicted membrane chloride channel (bestrophin family)
VYAPAIDQAGLNPNIVKYNSLLTSNTKPTANPFIAGVKLTLLLSSKNNSCYDNFSSRRTKWWVIGSKP